MQHKKSIRSFIILGTLLFVTTIAFSQQNMDSIRAKVDSLRKAIAPKTGIKPYEDVITAHFSTISGLFTIHQYKDTIYFEIPDSILHRDIEVINRLDKGPGGTGTYAGEVLDEHTIQFERNAADSSVRIRYDYVISSADSTSNIYRAVMNSNNNPVLISFPVKAYGKDSTSYIIDVSQYILKTPPSLFNGINSSSRLLQYMDPNAVKDMFVETIHAYPFNVEMTISKNGVSKGGRNIGAPPVGSPISLVTHTSFIELPKIPLQQRIQDPRVGYFADQVYHYGDQQQKVEDRRFILRWRLEPKEEDREKWKRGELVEPKKPIVIYIDPATPKQWRPYLIAGINDWQKAFEQAGFTNAIIGKEWPEGDTTMHTDDVRYSFINYMPSDIENAAGLQVHDPRSGEIIQTHINWYHNIMQLVHDWYLVQAGATDPRARHATFDDDLMGRLIRFVSSHEVGHTLGLLHNMGASSQTPVDSLRSKHYLELHGHTSSIMDYARFDYVAQPEDHISEYDLFPHVGEYDRWAIEWGYKRSNADNPEDDKKIMRQMVTDSVTKNRRLWYGAQGSPDPRCEMEDLGDDAMKAANYGIKNLQRILPNLPEWTREEGGIYDNLDDMYKALEDQYVGYMQHVMSNIGGVYTTLRSEEETKPVYEPVSKAMQKEAVAFFNRQLFNTPYWLMDKNVISKVSEPKQPGFVEDLQVKALNKLLDIGKIDQLLANQRQFGNKAYPVDEYINDIHKGIWGELKSGKAIDPYRRNLQKSYIGSLQSILLSTGADQTETDVFSILWADIRKLQSEISEALPEVKDPMTRYHLQDLQVRIKKTLEANPVIQ